MAGEPIRWIVLNDGAARLKLGTLAGSDGGKRTFLFLTGLERGSDKWNAAISRMGFASSAKSRFLARAVHPSDKIRPAMFQPIWPRAMMQSLDPKDVLLDLAPKQREAAMEQAQPQPEAKSDAVTAEENRLIQMDAGEMRLLSRNLDGNRVYDSPFGRFLETDAGKRIAESESRVSRPELFLRVTNGDLTYAADGFVQSMLHGEVQRSEDMANFLYAIHGREIAEITEAEIKEVRAAIDAANVRYLNASFDTAQDAYGTANILYQYMPPRAADSLGAGAMPLPLSVIAQRLLGDTGGQTVHVPNAFDGASFAFLSRNTDIRAYRGDAHADLSPFVRNLREDEVRWGHDFFQSDEREVDAIFFNADPSRMGTGARGDYHDATQALKRLRQGGRAILVLSGDEGMSGGSMSEETRDFVKALGWRYDIESAIEISTPLVRGVGGTTPLRLLSVRNAPAHAQSWRADKFAVAHSWDDLKSHVDEEIVRLEIREAETEEIDLEAARRENEFQRPYLAFSRVGEVRTMVPKNLQGPLQYALTQLERKRGPVDGFVSGKLGYGPDTLADRFSPEQVDALALTFDAWEEGRAPIIGDDTGIGKGRICAASFAAGLRYLANLEGSGDSRLENGGGIIFITDRANLFSDMMRDLRDVGEFGRVRPLLMNSNSTLTDIFTGEVVAKGTPLKQLKGHIESDSRWNDLNANVIFMTYSQISGKDSIKADWVRRLASSSVVLADEAHIAAGANSNISMAVTDIMSDSLAGLYLSATWSKSSDNLGVYRKAMPESINMATLAETMRVGGEPFIEVFSSMMARDGMFIRREHDMSKISFDVSIDNDNRRRNEAISDQVAAILAAMTYMNGDLEKLLSKFNRETIRILTEGRNARNTLQLQGGEGGQADLMGRTLMSTAFGGGSTMYVTMRRLLTMLNVDNTAAEALRALEENGKPIIAFDETGEAFVRKRMQEQAIPDPDGGKPILPNQFVVPTLRDMLREIASGMLMLRLREVTEEDLDDGGAELAAREQALREAEIQQALERDLALERGEDLDQAAQDEDQDEDHGEDRVQAGAGGVAAQVTDTQNVETQDAEIDVTTAAQQAERARSRAVVQTTRIQMSREGLIARGGDPEKVDQIIAAHEKLMELVDDLPPIPLNVIDLVQMKMEGAGFSVGEISGRKMALRPVDKSLYNEPIDSPVWATALWEVRQRMPEKEKLQSRDDFNNGRTDVICLNRAGSAGISLHASPRFADIRRRSSIDLQISEDPTTRLQINGRANRFDQVVPPNLITSTPGIYGETRQLMMQNKKLAKLSASTRSSRENPAEMEHVPDLLNPVGEKVARDYLMDNGGFMRRTGITLEQLNSPGFQAINRLTSRAVLLSTVEQRAMFRELEQMFEDEVERLEEAGENPLRTKEMDVRAREIGSSLFIGVDGLKMKSAFDEPVYLKTMQWDEKFNGRNTTELYLDCLGTINKMEQEGRCKIVDNPQHDAKVQAIGLKNGWLTGQDHSRVHQASLPEDVPQWQQQAMLRAAQLDDEEREGCAVRAELPEIVVESERDVLLRFMQARAGIEMAQSDYADEAEALSDFISLGQHNTVSNLLLQRMWLEQNFDKLLPGTMLSIPDPRFRHLMREGNGNNNRRTAQELMGGGAMYETGLLMGLETPAREMLAQLSRWRLKVWMPATAKMRSISLQQVMKNLDCRRSEQLGVEILSDYKIRGKAFVPSDERSFEAMQMHRLTSDARPMLRQRKAAFLTGNMYLASEWAMANNAGRGVIYTDKDGVRQRGVHLNISSLEMEAMQQKMPVRIWTQDMIGAILGRAFASQSARELCPDLVGNRQVMNQPLWRFYTRYKDAMKVSTPNAGADDGIKGAVLNVLPGKGVFMQVGKGLKPAALAAQMRNTRMRILSEMIPDFHNFWKRTSRDERKALQDSVFTVAYSNGGKKKMRGIMLSVDDMTEAQSRMQSQLPAGQDMPNAEEVDPATITAENFWLPPQRRFELTIDAINKAMGLDLYIPRVRVVSDEYYLYEQAKKMQQEYFMSRGAEEVEVSAGDVDVLHDLEQENQAQEQEEAQRMRVDAGQTA